MSIASLKKKIDAFCAQRSQSDGGYAPVAEDDIQALYEIFSGLVQARYEADPDGDYPVNIHLVDRTRHQGFYFQPLPRLDEAGQVDLARAGELIEGALSNLETAQRDMAEAVRGLRYGVVDRASKGMPIACDGKPFEAHHRLVSARALRQEGRAALQAWVDKHPPGPGCVDDYQAKIAWQEEARQVIGRGIGTVVAVRLVSRSQGKPFASLGFPGLVEREEDEHIFVEIPSATKALGGPGGR